jgi:hypothetical protein
MRHDNELLSSGGIFKGIRAAQMSNLEDLTRNGGK